MNIGLVLSGGGLKGNAHIGVLAALEELGIKPAVLAGTSAGAIVAAMYATGMAPPRMLEVSMTFNKGLLNVNAPGLWRIFWRLLTFNKHPFDGFQGFLSATQLDVWFRNLFQDRQLSSIDLPLALVATDITSGREVVLSNHPVNVNDCINVTQARLSDAVRASMSVPIIFTPRVIEGYQLIDGGVLDNLPVDAARSLGADKIIAVNLEYAAGMKEADDLVEIAGKSIQLLTNRSQFYKSFIADAYINPNLAAYVTDDFSPTDAKAMYLIGYHTTMAMRTELLALLA